MLNLCIECMNLKKGNRTDMAHKNGKIAEEIIALQNADGTWGNEFHSLSIPNKKKTLTTEQASSGISTICR